MKKLSDEEVRKLGEELAGLPKGCISQKRIRGKVTFYRQWTEGGRTRSQYLTAAEARTFRKQMLRRRQLQRMLRPYLAPQRTVRKTTVVSVKTGEALRYWARGAAAWERRDKFPNILKYLRWRQEPRVCVIYGLRRTGQTTMLMQAALELTEEEFSRAAYLKATVDTSIYEIDRILKDLESRGYRYVFIDEVTLMEDFIDAAAVFSDVYAAGGMKIVLSGTDSLGFWFASDNELYDRAYMIHTTVIPYAEHARLLKTDDIDDYIRYGGMLQAGELAFRDADARRDDASFRDDESTRRYIDTAIAQNIQRSLRCFQHGSRFFSLKPLFEAGELTNVINRIVEDMNHDFLVSVVTRPFKSGDLHASAKILLKGTSGERTVAVSEEQVRDVRNWLEKLDLLADVRVRRANGNELDPRPVFTQPGMRFCMAQALVDSLFHDRRFLRLEASVRNRVRNKILDEVRGRMLEDIVLFETTRSCRRRGGERAEECVFKLLFDSGEYDMVTLDPQGGGCRLYEIKHSTERVPAQARHLLSQRERLPEGTLKVIQGAANCGQLNWFFENEEDGCSADVGCPGARAAQGLGLQHARPPAAGPAAALQVRAGRAQTVHSRGELRFPYGHNYATIGKSRERQF